MFQRNQSEKSDRNVGNVPNTSRVRRHVRRALQRYPAARQGEEFVTAEKAVQFHANQATPQLVVETIRPVVPTSSQAGGEPPDLSPPSKTPYTGGPRWAWVKGQRVITNAKFRREALRSKYVGLGVNAKAIVEALSTPKHPMDLASLPHMHASVRRPASVMSNGQWRQRKAFEELGVGIRTEKKFKERFVDRYYVADWDKRSPSKVDRTRNSAKKAARLEKRPKLVKTRVAKVSVAAKPVGIVATLVVNRAPKVKPVAMRPEDVPRELKKLNSTPSIRPVIVTPEREEVIKQRQAKKALKTKVVKPEVETAKATSARLLVEHYEVQAAVIKLEPGGIVDKGDFKSKKKHHPSKAHQVRSGPDQAGSEFTIWNSAFFLVQRPPTPVFVDHHPLIAGHQWNDTSSFDQVIVRPIFPALAISPVTVPPAPPLVGIEENPGPPRRTGPRLQAEYRIVAVGGLTYTASFFTPNQGEHRVHWEDDPASVIEVRFVDRSLQGLPFNGTSRFLLHQDERDIGVPIFVHDGGPNRPNMWHVVHDNVYETTPAEAQALFTGAHIIKDIIQGALPNNPNLLAVRLRASHQELGVQPGPGAIYRINFRIPKVAGARSVNVIIHRADLEERVANHIAADDNRNDGPVVNRAIDDVLAQHAAEAMALEDAAPLPPVADADPPRYPHVDPVPFGPARNRVAEAAMARAAIAGIGPPPPPAVPDHVEEEVQTRIEHSTTHRIFTRSGFPELACHVMLGAVYAVACLYWYYIWYLGYTIAGLFPVVSLVAMRYYHRLFYRFLGTFRAWYEQDEINQRISAQFIENGTIVSDKITRQIWLTQKIIALQTPPQRVPARVADIVMTNASPDAKQFRLVFGHPPGWTPAAELEGYFNYGEEVLTLLTRHSNFLYDAPGAHSGRWVRKTRGMSIKPAIFCLFFVLFMHTWPFLISALSSAGGFTAFSTAWARHVDVDAWCPGQRWRDRVNSKPNWGIDWTDIQLTVGILKPPQPSYWCSMISCLHTAKDRTYCPWTVKTATPPTWLTVLNTVLGYTAPVEAPSESKSAAASFAFSFMFWDQVWVTAVLGPILEEVLRITMPKTTFLLVLVEFILNTLRGLNAVPALALHSLFTLGSGVARRRRFKVNWLLFAISLHSVFNYRSGCAALASTFSCASFPFCFNSEPMHSNVIALHGYEHPPVDVTPFPIEVTHNSQLKESKPGMWVLLELCEKPFTFFRQSVDNLVAGLVNRVYTTPDPDAPLGITTLPLATAPYSRWVTLSLFEHFTWFKELTYKQYIQASKNPRLTHIAVHGPEGSRSLQDGALTNKGPKAMVKLEVSKVSLDKEGNYKPAFPRIIVFPSMVENAVVGRVMAPLSKMIYGAINALVCQFGHLHSATVVSGYNNDEIASSVVSTWNQLAEIGPPAVIISDLVKFDASCGPEVRGMTLGVLRRGLYFCRRKCSPRAVLQYLANTLVKKIVSFSTTGLVKATIKGQVATGFADTSVSARITVPVTTVEALAKPPDLIDPTPRIDVFGLTNAGDDQLTCVLAADSDRAINRMVNTFSSHGMKLEVEKVALHLYEIEFCQQVLLVGDGVPPRFCCNMNRVSKAAYSMVDISKPKDYYNRLFTLGQCNLACYAGLPVMDSFWRMFLRSGLLGGGTIDLTHLTYIQRERLAYPSYNADNIHAYRIAFERATGVSMERQLALEDKYANMTLVHKGCTDLGSGRHIYDLIPGI